MGQVRGFESALEALRALDSKAQERILSDISKKDPEMAARLKNHLVVFEDLIKVNPQGLVRLFQEIPESKWVLALRGKPVTFTNAVFQHLTKRKVEELKTSMVHLGPQALSKVEAAQREIVEKALELESRGLLLISRNGDPLV